MGQNFSSEPVVDKETGCAENETFKVAVTSCQGWRMSQEDNHSLMLELPQSEHKASFFAVYDGHGSARVSKHASEGLWRHLISNPYYKKGNFKDALEQAFLSFDKEVNEKYTAQLAGTTAICVLIVDNVIYCANIGDSRAVASVNCECEPLSHDHKPDNPDELRRILVAGGYVLGNRVNGNLALSRAFGDFHYKTNEQLSPEEQIVSPFPDIKRIELNDDVDFILLACDGIWDVLTNEEVVKFVIDRLEQNMEPSEICEQLTTRCIAPDYELVIGCDNMTVLLICHTRGQSWPDYCTNIFNKNTKKLGVPRTRSFNPVDLIDETDVHRRGQQQLRQQQQQQYEQDNRREQDDANDGPPATAAAAAAATSYLPFWARGTCNSAATGGGGDDDDSLSSATNASDHMNSNDDFASHIPRDIRMLLDAIQNLHTDDGPNFETGGGDTSSSSRITEISGDVENNEAENDANNSQNLSTESKSDDSKAIENSTNDGKNNDIINKTTELHLDGAPKDEGDEQHQGEQKDELEAKDDGDDKQEEGQISNSEIVTNTVEIQLDAPSEEDVSEEAPNPLVVDNTNDEEQNEQQQQEEGETGGGDVNAETVDSSESNEADNNDE